MTVGAIAASYDLDLDDTLITLWDAGLDNLNSADDLIPSGLTKHVHRVLGLHTPNEMRTLKFWEDKLGVTPAQLRLKLSELGVDVSASARVLPKGGLAKLRRYLRSLPIAEPPSSSHVPVQRPVKDQLSPAPPYEWKSIGTSRVCQHLNIDELIQIHEALERDFALTEDPISPSGIRDRALLESAVHRPQTSLGNEDKYQTPELVAAALMHSIAQNHGFFNGNKRTAVVALLVSLDRNRVVLQCDQQELFRCVLRVAQHRLVPQHWSMRADREVQVIAQWVCDNSRTLLRGDHAIKWKDLRRILTRLGCEIGRPTPGNKIKVYRQVATKGFLGVRRSETLVAHAWYAGEGRELTSDQVAYVRHQLRLDEAAGYDSEHFYGADPREPDEFIAEYRSVLKRLARL